MSDAERLDHERMIEQLTTELERWRTVARCRYCLPFRAHWCRVHRDQAPTVTEGDQP